MREMIQMATYTTEQITTIGGREWTSHDGRHHRVYLNRWHSLVNLHIETYNTGNVRSATINGEHISNSAGNDLRNAKVYLDVTTGQIVTDLGERANGRYLDGDALVAKLHAGIAAQVKAASSRGMTSREAAAELGVSVRTVQRRAATGKLAASKDARGRWIITL